MDMKKRIVIMLLLTAVMLNGCKADSTAERPAADSVTALDRVAQTGDNKAEDKKAEESAVKESSNKEKYSRGNSSRRISGRVLRAAAGNRRRNYCNR